MSKKFENRRKPQKKALNPLILMIGGGGLLIAAALFVAFGNRDGGTPVASVDQQVIDFGDVKFSTEKSFAITITNTGDGTLRFKEEPYIEVREGC